MWLELHTTNGNPVIVNMDLVVSVDPSPPEGGGARLRALLLVGAEPHSIIVRESVINISKAVKATKPKP